MKEARTPYPLCGSSIQGNRGELGVYIKMRLLAFSDWRVQPVEDVFRFVRSLQNPIDFVFYAGDDLGRFMEEGTNYLADLANYTTQGKVLAIAGNDDFSEVNFTHSALWRDCG